MNYSLLFASYYSNIFPLTSKFFFSCATSLMPFSTCLAWSSWEQSFLLLSLIFLARWSRGLAPEQVEKQMLIQTLHEATWSCTIPMHNRHTPPPAAATVAGEAPASRSWFCREKSMLYHSAALSTGLGGITRLGFSRTSRIWKLMAICLLIEALGLRINKM